MRSYIKLEIEKSFEEQMTFFQSVENKFQEVEVAA
jgi:hypothetical protein